MNMAFLYKNRRDAGKKLAEKLKKYKGKDVFIFAIPRGGVPVGYEVAKFLEAPLDVIVARKLHIPWNPEAGFGALAPDGTAVLNEEMVADFGIDEKVVREVKKEVLEEIKRREKVYRGEKIFPKIKNKIVIVVDDGLASGYTMMAAVDFLKKKKPAKIIVAVPTSSESAYAEVKEAADETVSLYVQKGYPYAVASFYKEWRDLTDEEVINYLV
jgi:putative phosphoribosyl transferase